MQRITFLPDLEQISGTAERFAQQDTGAQPIWLQDIPYVAEARRPRSVRWKFASVLLAATGFSFGGIAVAEIQVTPRLQLRQTWTDNANLDVVGGSSGDFITTISPGVEVSGATNRIEAFIDYTLNGLIFWKDSENSDIRHQLNAAVNTEVYEDKIFIDLRANVQQQFANFAGPITNVIENTTQNRQTVQTYAVTPRYREEIGSTAVAELAYTFSYTDVSLPGRAVPFGLLSNNLGHLVNFRLSSGPRFEKFTWNWNTSYNVIDRDVRNIDFESFNTIFDGTYNITRKVALLGSVGYEDIRDDTLIVPQQGVIWDVGLLLRPGPRTQLEGRVGRRFGDTVFSADLRYAFSDTDIFRASYSENLTVANRNAFGLLDGFEDRDGDGFIEPPLFDGPLLGPSTFLTDAAFRQKRATVSLERQLRRTSLQTAGFWERREIPNVQNSNSFGLQISGQYRIDGAQSVDAQFTYRRDRFGNVGAVNAGPQQTNNFIGFGPGYTYRFSPNFNASARYTYGRNYGQGFALEQTSNTVSIAVTAFF